MQTGANVGVRVEVFVKEIVGLGSVPVIVIDLVGVFVDKSGGYGKDADVEVNVGVVVFVTTGIGSTGMG